MPNSPSERLFIHINQMIEQSRTIVKQTFNTTMVQAYWHIGRLIVEFEQNGNARAEYGKAQLQTLLVLNWTHDRALLSLENADARLWYINESINQGWSARALERQISVLYYERLLATQLENVNYSQYYDSTNNIFPLW